jgi:DNA-binding transcriptional ArsR family regulator
MPDPELTSLERTALYKSLGNPLRRRILDYLGRHGEANSTVLARELGESSGTTSYHLRKLADQHLIEEIAEPCRSATPHPIRPRWPPRNSRRPRAWRA